MVLPGFLFQKKMVALTAATQGASTRAARLLYEAIFEAETVTTQRGEDRVKRIWQELSTLSAAKSSACFRRLWIALYKTRLILNYSLSTIFEVLIGW